MDRSLLELNRETKDRLDRLKSHPEESYDLVLNRLIDTYENGDRLTREDVAGIREALRDLKEGRSPAHGQVREELAPGREMPPAGVGDPQAVKTMEEMFSGAAEKPDPEITESDSSNVHEIDPYDKRGRSRTSHLDSL
jgi:predicted transcriptional regulator